MTAPHSVHLIENDMEKNPHSWPHAYEVRDALGRRPVRGDFGTYFGFNLARDGDEAGHRAKMAAEEARVKHDWFSSLPVGVRQGSILESARTVRSRALNALSYIHREDIGLPREDLYTVEEQEIVHDLEVAAGILDKWKRTGPTPKYPGAAK